ncbi:hypothetical protein [Halomonas sp. I5-271120]|uniref:hypothetical protein n=1 Tax=Halomonas sp. I5-271120 TaxID=3061632 RepID=UPI0027151656|nr:hypothetical protein [Halomonas sp. I5-271120]
MANSIIMGLIISLARVSVGGLALGGAVTMACMHLWPDVMAEPYAWVGEGLKMAGVL